MCTLIDLFQLSNERLIDKRPAGSRQYIADIDLYTSSHHQITINEHTANNVAESSKYLPTSLPTYLNYLPTCLLTYLNYLPISAVLNSSMLTHCKQNFQHNIGWNFYIACAELSH